MKIVDFLNKKTPSISFEVFPPKTAVVFDSVKQAVEKIAQLNPAFMSVTYGAGGGTSEYTVSIAENMQKNHNVTALAHLSCISSAKDEVLVQLKKLKATGIENILGKSHIVKIA